MNQSSRHLDKTLDDHGETVVKSVGDGVHVVGEAAHGVAVRVLVKIFQRKFLHGMEQIPADIVDDLLSGFYHGLGVSPGCQGAGQINGGGDGHAEDQAADVARYDIAVDQRFYHVGAKKIGKGADGDQHRHHSQQKFVHAHVRQQPGKGMSEIFWSFPVQWRRHITFLLPECPSSGTRRFPGKWGWRREGFHGRPQRGSFRRPG